MWMTVLTSVMMAVVTAVVGVIGKAVTAWTKRQQTNDDVRVQSDAQYDAMEAIRIGVDKAQQDIVDSAKAAAADGKITSDELKAELKKAEDVARTTAYNIATGPALDWLSQKTTDAVNALINSVVQRNKPGE